MVRVSGAVRAGVGRMRSGKVSSVYFAFLVLLSLSFISRVVGDAGVAGVAYDKNWRGGQGNIRR